jgi:histidine triad (HIT) family protein
MNTADKDFYCKNIISGHIPVKIVEETKHILAYYHTQPQWPVHIVVIPKFHVKSLLEFDDGEDELMGEMMEVLKKVVRMVKEKYGGCRLTTNFGKFQETKHLHWHIYTTDHMD